MSLQPTGTFQNSVDLFNSAVLTINSVEIGEISNVSVSESFDVKKTMGLNTIKPRRIKRSNLQQEVTFEINAGLYKKVYELFYSSSSAVSGGTQYTVKDGQQDAMTCYITGYQGGDTSKPVQYQLQNPVISAHNPTNAEQEFTTTSVTVACTEIVLFEDSDIVV